jgi:hypothetical protein
MKKRILLTLLGTVFVAAAAIYLASKPLQNGLDVFLKQVAAVEIGKTTLQDWRTQLEQAHISNWNVTCDQQKCWIGWHGENSLLKRLHLAPRTVVDAGVGFKDGTASEIYIILVTLSRGRQGNWDENKGVVVRERPDRATCREQYDVDVKKRYGTGDRYWATVTMDTCVSPENRAKAIAISTSCLTRIGGCRAVESMIPKVFGPS